MDNLTREERSKQMASIRSTDTKPEMRVRRLVHRLGFRYRLHGAGLPGKPDLVFTSRRKVIFVNGCFWHGHHCRLGRVPKSNVEYWNNKIATNQARDRRNIKQLKKLDWKCLTIWECRSGDEEALTPLIERFLNSTEDR